MSKHDPRLEELIGIFARDTIKAFSCIQSLCPAIIARTRIESFPYHTVSYNTNKVNAWFQELGYSTQATQIQRAWRRHIHKRKQGAVVEELGLLPPAVVAGFQGGTA